jgi:hypothetical protein
MLLLDGVYWKEIRDSFIRVFGPAAARLLTDAMLCSLLRTQISKDLGTVEAKEM